MLLCSELVQGDIVLDVFGDERAVLRWHGLEVAVIEKRIGCEILIVLALDDVAHAAAGDVGLEVGLYGRDGRGLFGLGVGDELGELLFQQFILGLEARDEAEDFFQDFAQRQAPIYGGGFAQLVEGVVLLGLVEDLTIDIVDDAIPLPDFDALGDEIVFPHGVFKPLEEHAVDFHAFSCDLLNTQRGDDVAAEVFVGATDHYGAGTAAILAALALG